MLATSTSAGETPSALIQAKTPQACVSPVSSDAILTMVWLRLISIYYRRCRRCIVWSNMKKIKKITYFKERSFIHLVRIDRLLSQELRTIHLEMPEEIKRNVGQKFEFDFAANAF